MNNNELLKKPCKEYYDTLPLKSEHCFDTDGHPHNNPIKCIRCGVRYSEWRERVLDKAKAMPEIEAVISKQIKINKLK